MPKVQPQLDRGGFKARLPRDRGRIRDRHGLRGHILPGAALARSTLSPDVALARRMDGNARFVAGRPAAFDEDLAILGRNTAEKQGPLGAVLGTAAIIVRGTRDLR